MAHVDFISQLHKRTSRDYLERVVEHDKPHCATVARKWDYDYWDGERKFGYGGMRYDGRWRSFAKVLSRHYDLKPGQRVLDVGCGKGFLLYELTQVVSGLEVVGLDISSYAIAHSKEEIQPQLIQGNCSSLPFPTGSFDLVISITTLHNLPVYDLMTALKEIQRVGRQNRYICVESYRDEQEKANLLYWQLTCETFFTPREWDWFLELAGYAGDLDCIFFE